MRLDSKNHNRNQMIAGGVTVLLLLPFIAKAYHIDDPMYLWGAEQILKHPFDFYGFNVNWSLAGAAMADATKNPPGISYFIALASLPLVGLYFEAGMHFFFLFPALALTAGTYCLAQRFCSRPLEAALAMAVAPVFVVSATNVMADVLMLAFYVWAIESWLRGIEEENRRWLIAAGVFAALSFFTKFYGITLLPLLAVHGFMLKRKAGAWLLPLLIPVAALLVLEIWTFSLYDKGLFFGSAGFATARSGDTDYGLFTVLTTGLCFMGGSIACLFFYTPYLWSKRGLIVPAAIFLVCLIGFSLTDQFGKLTLSTEEDGRNWMLSFQAAIFAAAGLQIALIAGLDVWRHRDALSVMLALWIFGTFVWATYVNWHLSARVVFPMVMPVCIVMVRRLEHAEGLKPLFTRGRLVPLALSACVALLLARADYAWAGSQREMAAKYRAEVGHKTETVLFQGHWGWQWYMELHGFKIFHPTGMMVPVQHTMIVPENAHATVHPQRETVVGLRIDEIQGQSMAATMSKPLGAGFYSDVWGPLPYAFGPVPIERYFVYSISLARQ